MFMNVVMKKKAQNFSNFESHHVDGLRPKQSKIYLKHTPNSTGKS